MVPMNTYIGIITVACILSLQHFSFGEGRHCHCNNIRVEAGQSIMNLYPDAVGIYTFEEMGILNSSLFQKDDKYKLYGGIYRGWKIFGKVEKGRYKAVMWNRYCKQDCPFECKDVWKHSDFQGKRLPSSAIKLSCADSELETITSARFLLTKSSVVANENGCCFKVSISSHGPAQQSVKTELLGAYNIRDRDLIYKTAYLKWNNDGNRIYLIFRDNLSRWELNHDENGTLPPKAKFPCEAQCPEDCHNSSQFEFYNKEGWTKDETLQITCANNQPRGNQLDEKIKEEENEGNENSSSNTIWFIVGGVAVLSVVGLTVGLIIFVLMKRKDATKRKASDKNLEEELSQSRDVPVDALLKGTFALPPRDEFQELNDNDQKRNGIMSDLTMSQGQRYNDGKHGKLNVQKNILPYDQSRVKLKTPIRNVDYINASWIQRANDGNVYDDVYDFLASSKMNFILTQDPTQDSHHHYFMMMFEQKVDVIVHVGSDRNLPQWDKISFGNVYLELVESVNLNEHVQREKLTIFVKSDVLINSHPVTVYHFSAWPSDDQYGESDSKNILTLISLIQRDIGKPTKEFTMAAHDASGGVTGASSFIALFQMQQDLNTKLKVREKGLMDISRKQEIEYINVFDKINELRKQRSKMISTFENYKFLYTTLAHYAKNQSQFEKIAATVEDNTEQRRLAANHSMATEQHDDDEVEYVYSDEIFIDPLYQNESINEANVESDIYVN